MQEHKISAREPHFSLTTERYLLWVEAEQAFSPETISKRRECLRQVARITGEKPLEEFGADDLLRLKKEMLRHNHSSSWQCSSLYSLKGLLDFAGAVEHRNVFPPEAITFP